MTFFISEETIKVDRITYIVDNFSNIHNLVTFPICSTIILLTIIPFISNGAYWLNLKFENWKKEQKNQIEKKQLLTLEQSLELREQLVLQENRFEKLLTDKNDEIKQLKGIIENYNLSHESKTTNIYDNETETIISDVLDKIKSNPTFTISFQKLIEIIQGGYQATERSDIPTNLITLLEVNNLIVSKGNGVYTLSESGKKLTKYFMDILMN